MTKDKLEGNGSMVSLFLQVIFIRNRATAGKKQE